MSSQDSEEDCPVSYQPLDKNIFKDTYPYIWYPDEEDEEEDEPVPPRFKQESKEALCKRIIKLEIENDELRIDNFTLRHKFEREKGKPASSQQLHLLHQEQRRHNHMGMGTPLGNCQAWGRCPGIVSPSQLLSLPFFLVRSY